MHKITTAYTHHLDAIKLEWNLGKRCNYDCSYCPSAIHDNSSPHTSIAVLKNTVDQLLELDKPLRISFTGGEPTVHPQFQDLIQYIKQYPEIKFISVTTNGTRRASYYINLGIDQLVVSLHFEHDWGRVLDTVLQLTINDKPITTHKWPQIITQVMCHQEKMADVRKCVAVLEKYRLNYTLRRVRWTLGDHDLFDDMRYDQHDLDWILSHHATIEPNTEIISPEGKELLHSNDIIKLHKNQFKGYSCSVGLESLMIDGDGEVYRATCREGGSLGNIYRGSFNKPQSPIVCGRNYCTCSADIPITKIKL
jgi:MoaA/NifB/PqqE/SkfB family radical SAM enzyme